MVISAWRLGSYYLQRLFRTDALIPLEKAIIKSFIVVGVSKVERLSNEIQCTVAVSYCLAAFIKVQLRHIRQWLGSWEFFLVLIEHFWVDLYQLAEIRFTLY